MNIMNEDQTARCVGLSREAETDEPYLLVEGRLLETIGIVFSILRNFPLLCRLL